MPIVGRRRSQSGDVPDPLGLLAARHVDVVDKARTISSEASAAVESPM